MMNCKRSSRLSFFNYLLFLPITLGLLLTLQPLNAQTASTVEDLNIDPGQSIYMKITASMSEEEVNKISKRVEETGVDFRGSKFEFNQKGQLSRASLNVKVANFNASVQSSGDGKSPMKEPVIFYLLREADDKLGVSVGLPSDLSPDHRRIFTKFNGLMIGHFSAD